MTKNPTRPAADPRYLVFALAGRLCALPTGAIREVLPLAELARPPGIPPTLEGFARLAAEVIPVVRLGRLFDLPSTLPTASSAIVVLRRAAPLGLLVDAARAVVSLPDDAWTEVAGETTFGACTVAETRIDDERVALLAADRLLLREEEARIDAYATLERERLAAWAGTPE